MLTFTIAWVLVAVVATTAAWQGVALVTDEVTDDRPAALAASDVQDQLAEGSAAGTTAPPPDSTAATTTTTSPPTTGTTQPAPAPVTKTYRLTGGVVTISFSPTQVTATGVRPNPGFGIKKSEAEGTGWRVEFENDSHRSRLDAWWDNGPRDDTREDPR